MRRNLSLQRIGTHVDLKIHANFVINIHNVLSQRLELTRNYYLIIDIINSVYMFACLFVHTISFFIQVFNKKCYVLFRWVYKFVDEEYPRIPRKLSQNEF